MQHPSLLRAVWFLLLVGAMLLLGQLRPPVFASKPLAFIWPVSGMDSADLPHSSAYGPRLKASEDFRYDYHQGIDIPTPLNTPLLAVADGTVGKGASPAMGVEQQGGGVVFRQFGTQPADLLQGPGAHRIVAADAQGRPLAVEAQLHRPMQDGFGEQPAAGHPAVPGIGIAD